MYRYFLNETDGVRTKSIIQLLSVLMIIVPIIMYGVISSVSKSEKIEANSKIIKAEIYKVAKASGTRHNYYQFTIDGKKVNNGFVSSWDLKKGDVIFVRYFCEDPEINEAVTISGRKYVLECDSLLLVE